jgi:F-type H+-transporting ATPase subunit b
VLTAVVTLKGALVQVSFVAAEEGEEKEDPAKCEFTEVDEATGETVCGDGPSPIAPEAKEIAWGAGAFIVLALAMRFFLFPRLKKGMDARYAHIRAGHEQADAARASATSEVASYESALAAVKAEANERVEAARRTLESERQAKLAEVNARIGAKREAAAAEAQAARDAARAEVASAAADVAARTVELSVGRAPDAGAVRSAVDAAMGAGVAS